MPDMRERENEAVAGTTTPGPEADSALDALDDQAGVQAEGQVRCEDIGGVAGTGKTTLIKQRIADNPRWGLLTATTGIASVNLDAVTLNSTLAYFDTDSLRDSYLCGHLTRRMHKLALEYDNLVIDEKSMLDAAQLDLIYQAIQQANEYKDVRHLLGIVTVGDFAQLPVVRGRWAFEADCWPEFERNRTHLTKIWRQDQAEFLNALNAARRGDGRLAADILTSVGIEWRTGLDVDYDGTTLVPKNDQVDRYNQMRLTQHSGAKLTTATRRWGQQRSEWTKNIPPRAEFKIGCYVMVLANSGVNDETKKFDYVNGDCGHIVDKRGSTFLVKLLRTQAVVKVPPLLRAVTSKSEPDNWRGSNDREDGWIDYKHRDERGRYVLGQIEYTPLRLAYASTVHKSQGLSLDKVQIDFRNSFMAQPGMLYVSLSRCRTLEGLRLVGQRELFAKQCNSDPRVAKWL